MYSRWEYVDRPAIPIQSLWTINPDGTGHIILSGNYNFYRMGWLAYAKPIPNSRRVLFATAYVHGLAGMVAIVLFFAINLPDSFLTAPASMVRTGTPSTP